MKRKTIRKKQIKAASAALAFLSLSLSPIPSGAFTSQTGEFSALQTLPESEQQETAELYETICRRFAGREADAPILMKEFLNRYPASAQRASVALMLADWYFFEGEYTLALDYYNSIADGAFSGDTRRNMLYRKAFAMIKTGYYPEARVYFQSLKGSKEFGDNSRFYLAYLDYVDGKYDSAYEQFQAIKSTGTRDAEAEYYINQIDYLRGDYRKVANTSERLLSGGKIPDELLAETMRVGGLSFFKLGDKTTARNILGNYAELTGDGAELAAIYSLATIYYDEGNYERALPLFSTVTDYPGDLAQSAWLYMGQIYLNQGDPQAAALAFDKAAKESWNTDVAQTAAYNLAVTSTEGRGLPFADSARAMEDFIETYPDSPYAESLSNYLANAYYGRRDYENALKQIDRISHPDSQTKAMRQKILYQLGVSQLQQGNTKGAIESLTEASAQGTPDKEVAAQAALWLGDAYYARKDYAAASKAYETAVSSGKLGNNSALANYNLGYALMKLKNYKKAENAFKSAMNSSMLTPSQSSDAKLRYADCLYYNGNYNEALQIFRQVKTSGGEEGIFAAIREADILGRNGNVGEKITILEGLYRDNRTGAWKGTVISRLADAYSEKGDDRKAAELYATMLDNPEGSPADQSQLYYSLAANAENLYKAGDREAAYSAYKRLEASGIDALYPSAIMGIMRTAVTPAEVELYADKASTLSGLTAEETDEAIFRGAQAALASGTGNKAKAIAALEELASSSDRTWGARSAVLLGETLLKDGNTEKAEEVLLDLIDSGSDDNYWLARGYITLADVYIAQKKDYLAKLYLETLRSNYPGNEKDIKEMINQRLNSLKQ